MLSINSGRVAQKDAERKGSFPVPLRVITKLPASLPVHETFGTRACLVGHFELRSHNPPLACLSLCPCPLRPTPTCCLEARKVRRPCCNGRVRSIPLSRFDQSPSIEPPSARPRHRLSSLSSEPPLISTSSSEHRIRATPV